MLAFSPPTKDEINSSNLFVQTSTDGFYDVQPSVIWTTSQPVPWIVLTSLSIKWHWYWSKITTRVMPGGKVPMWGCRTSSAKLIKHISCIDPFWAWWKQWRECFGNSSLLILYPEKASLKIRWGFKVIPLAVTITARVSWVMSLADFCIAIVLSLLKWMLLIQYDLKMVFDPYQSHCLGCVVHHSPFSYIYLCSYLGMWLQLMNS